MAQRDIIVVGASAGGIEPLKTLLKGLPADLPAAMFVVWHMSPDITSVLPRMLGRESRLNVAQATDGEAIVPGRIYIARPDHHLLIERGFVRVTKGPKENRFRPAVDPLFRSAAYAYEGRVIGVVLSGALDDGTAGLWTIKQRGGIAVVQDPEDAEVASMPRSAMREVAVDHSVPAVVLPDLLIRLVGEPASAAPTISMQENDKTRIEIRIAAEDNAFELGIMKMGELTPFTCPDCHGVFLKFVDGKLVRFRCHTGHAYSPDTLLAAVTESIEQSLWNAIRAVEESVMLLNHTSEQLADGEQQQLIEKYQQKAREAEARVQQMRQAVMSHEQLSGESLRRETEGANGYHQ